MLTQAPKGTKDIFGAEIKIWKFNLGKASMPFYIKSMDLWNFDLSFDPEDIHRKWQSQNQ